MDITKALLIRTIRLAAVLEPTIKNPSGATAGETGGPLLGFAPAADILFNK